MGSEPEGKSLTFVGQIVVVQPEPRKVVRGGVGDALEGYRPQWLEGGLTGPGQDVCPARVVFYALLGDLDVDLSGDRLPGFGDSQPQDAVVQPGVHVIRVKRVAELELAEHRGRLKLLVTRLAR